jgi:hypothetical protein
MAEPPRQEDPVNESALMHQWLENQRHELQVQSERLALNEKELEHNRILAEKTIEAQLKDRSEERVCTQSVFKQGLIFLGIILLMLLLFGGYVIHEDKEAFLSEIIGLIVELGKYLIGAVTGFFIAKSKYQPAEKQKDGDD